MFRVIIIITMFLIGLYFTATVKHSDLVEGFTDGANQDSKKGCYDLLVKKDGRFYLYNSKVSYVPGVNPIVFNGLAEYGQYMEWEKKHGIKCPILMVEHMIDSQNESKYNLMPKALSDPGEMKMFNGLNAASSSQPLNKPIDNPKIQKFNEVINEYLSDSTIDGNTTLGKSANAMDSNWGGTDYARKMVDNGHFTDHDNDERFNDILSQNL